MGNELELLREREVIVCLASDKAVIAIVWNNAFTSMGKLWDNESRKTQ